jgi:putative phosphoesterase
MKGLLIADIHANPWALRAVQQSAGAVDFILCAGDWVNYGPDPSSVIDWARDHQPISVLGNHDYAVTTGTDPKASPGKQPLALAMRDWTKQQLSPEQLEQLRKFPKTRIIEFGGAQFLILHATPFHPLYDYRLTPSISDAELDAVIAGLSADFLVVGHTHLPLLRKRHTICVVNPGSVGQSLDGDPRASYAIWEDGEIHLEKIAYDQRPMINAIHALHCLSEDQRDQLSNILVRGTSRL